MTLRLHYFPGACSLAVHILLRETGADFELALVDFHTGAQQSEDFLKLNPKGRVPVLVVGDEVLTELPALAYYLAGRAPAAGLWPSSLLEQSRCLEWFNWLSGTVHGYGFGELWRPGRFVTDESHHPHVRAAGRRWIDDSFQRIEASLTEGWAVGSAYSVVDPFLLVLYRWGLAIEKPMAADHPNWTRHFERLMEREAVQTALAREARDSGR